MYIYTIFYIYTLESGHIMITIIKDSMGIWVEIVLYLYEWMFSVF